MIQEWYVCPVCKGGLMADADAYRCPSCRRAYPVVLDIPDFRVFPDPYISIADDYHKGEVLEQAAGSLAFADLVARYWELTPGVPAALVREYVRAVQSRARAEEIWAELRRVMVGRRTVLDVGCGAGGLLSVAAAGTEQALGVDIAFRWLVVARKRLRELGINNVRLACACAEALPFPESAFSAVTADDVLDHTRDPAAAVREAGRVLRPGGVCLLTTPNRFSLTPDPHVWVWGVGLLPPRLRDGYVRRTRGIPYGPITPLSFFQLRRVLGASPGCRWDISPSPVVARARDRSLAAAAAVYNRVRRWPLLRRVFLLIGPGMRALGRKDRAGPSAISSVGPGGS